MKDLQIFNYGDNSIAFKNQGGITYINATEMAKPFGKLVADYIRLKSTASFVEAYIKSNPVMGNPITVIQGGLEQGTWMHEDIALDFAQWLSVDFRMWCNARIKELLTVGMTALPVTIEDMIANPDLVIGLATQVKELRKKSQVLEETNDTLKVAIQAQQPKVDYFDQVLQSESLITTTEVAALLGMSAMTLNKKLDEYGVQRRVNGRWVLTAKYNSQGYTKDKTVPIKKDENGNVTETSTLMYWTEKGKHFVIKGMKLKEEQLKAVPAG